MFYSIILVFWHIQFTIGNERNSEEIFFRKAPENIMQAMIMSYFEYKNLENYKMEIIQELSEGFDDTKNFEIFTQRLHDTELQNSEDYVSIRHVTVDIQNKILKFFLSVSTSAIFE